MLKRNSARQFCRSLNDHNAHHSQAGQVGIIIILIMIVILTVGLSIASRSTQQIEISVEDENSTKALNNAESGIEQAMSSIYQYETDATTEYDSTGGNEESGKYTIADKQTLEMKIPQGYSAHIPLQADAANLQFSWSKIACTVPANTAAILVGVYYLDPADLTTLRVQHYALDGCSSRASSSHFTSASTGTGDYKFAYTITLPAAPLFARIKPLYADTDLLVANLSSKVQYGILGQGKANTENKSIIVDRTIPAAPAFMDYALVSGDTITK